MTDTVKFNRSPRSADSREKTAQRKPWAPPSRLDAPPAPAGFKYRWIRSEIMGFEDKQNIYTKLREGYELVRKEELPEEYQDTMPAVEEGRNKGVVGVGGLLLAKIPDETVVERNNYYRQRAKDQMEAVDNNMMKESAHSTMRFQQPERNTRVSFGGSNSKSES
jgi:hypothetical protein